MKVTGSDSQKCLSPEAPDMQIMFCLNKWAEPIDEDFLASL